MLVGGAKFEVIGVASWHKQTLPHKISSTLEQVCPYFTIKSSGQVAYMKTHP